MKERLKRFRNRQLRQLFEWGQRFGADVLPRHYYSSIPDVARLRRDSSWRERRSMLGIAGADIEDQVAFASECCTPELRAWTHRQRIHEEACSENGARGFGPIEADFLFCFVASKRPRRVIQVGAGVSTAVMLAAANYVGYEIDLRCIDPYPTPYLRHAARAGDIELIAKRAQSVPLEALLDVGRDGLFFVDTTHTVRADSEVNMVVLEVLPRLPKDTSVHFHDIYFPYDYQRDLLSSGLFFWSETTLLHAFLVGNSRYALQVSMSMLHYACPDVLRQLLPNYRARLNDAGLDVLGREQGHFPSSTYVSVIA